MAFFSNPASADYGMSPDRIIKQIFFTPHEDDTRRGRPPSLYNILYLSPHNSYYAQRVPAIWMLYGTKLEKTNTVDEKDILKRFPPTDFGIKDASLAIQLATYVYRITANIVPRWDFPGLRDVDDIFTKAGVTIPTRDPIGRRAELLWIKDAAPLKSLASGAKAKSWTTRASIASHYQASQELLESIFRSETSFGGNSCWRVQNSILENRALKESTARRIQEHALRDPSIRVAGSVPAQDILKYYYVEQNRIQRY